MTQLWPVQSEGCRLGGLSVYKSKLIRRAQNTAKTSSWAQLLSPQLFFDFHTSMIEEYRGIHALCAIL